MIVKSFISSFLSSVMVLLFPFASFLDMHSRFRDWKKLVIVRPDIMVRWLMGSVFPRRFILEIDLTTDDFETL